MAFGSGLNENDDVNLSLTNDGGSFQNKDKLDDAQLTQRLQSTTAREPQPEVFICGARKLKYQHMAQVMAAVLKTGVLKFGFVTEPGGQVARQLLT